MNLPGMVQVHIDQASVPVPVDDLVAALWIAAEHGDLDPGRVRPGGDTAEELARAVVLYLLLTDHAGIVAARHQLATLPPGGHLAELADQARIYAAALFTTPDPDWDLPEGGA